MTHEGVAAVERALQILMAFRQGEPSLSLAEISRRTGLYKSTILRLAATLERHGFVDRPADRGFRLGRALLQLGSLYQESFQFRDVILPALAELRRATGETARFSIRKGERRVLLFNLDSTETLREHMLPGHSLPIDTSATGQVFRIMKSSGRRQAPFTLQTSGIKDPLTSSCAAPVVTVDGTFLGVLTISGPTARFTAAKRKAAMQKLTEVAAKLAPALRGVSTAS